MPKRSNTFQRLIRDLESAAHEGHARVTESAFVYNPTAGVEQEIDILVEFSIGGREYRTGIQVQDRSRKSGPDWVNSSAKQASQMGLDRMILVHSKGFTKSAIATAKAVHIELICPSTENDFPITDVLFPVHRIHMKHVGLVGFSFRASPTGKLRDGQEIEIDYSDNATVLRRVQYIAHRAIHKEFVKLDQNFMPTDDILDDEKGYVARILSFIVNFEDAAPLVIVDANGTSIEHDLSTVEVKINCSSFAIHYPQSKRVKYKHVSGYRLTSNSQHNRPEITFTPNSEGRFIARFDMNGFGAASEVTDSQQKYIHVSAIDIEKLSEGLDTYQGNSMTWMNYSYC